MVGEEEDEALAYGTRCTENTYRKEEVLERWEFEVVRGRNLSAVRPAGRWRGRDELTALLFRGSDHVCSVVSSES